MRAARRRLAGRRARPARAVASSARPTASCAACSAARRPRCRDRYDAASPARRLPLGVPLLLVHGARDDDVPVHISREFAAAATAAGDDCELVVIDDEGHYEHLEPDSRAWRAVVDWLRADARATPPRSTRADPLARLPRALRGRRRGADLPRRQLARPAARSPRATGCATLVDEWGDRLVVRLAGLDRRADARRRRARRGRARRAAGRGARGRLDDGQPVQARSAALDASSCRPRARWSPTATTSRPTATCSRAWPRSAASSCA